MPGLLDWVGYLGSLVVLISLLMSSIKKLRWINLVGAVIFAFYGFMIASIPTGFMNVGIAIIDIVFLVKMYKQKDFFRVYTIKSKEYLQQFFKFYKDDIKQFQDIDEDLLLEAPVRFYVLRNMTPASVFIAEKYDDETLEIKLDYAIPQYRDFKIGKFVFEDQKEYFSDLGYSKFIVFSDKKEHINYIKKMGFKELSLKKNSYIKSI
jgi:hypothetical protein